MAEKKPKPPVPVKPKFIPMNRSYGMSLPRLGNAIIINNVSKSVPGSEEDVKRLKEMYETVGFDVFVYRDPSSQELERLKLWMTIAETHKYCNTFSLFVIGHGTDEGELLNSGEGSFDTIQSLTDQISRIPTLFSKPKILLIQRYVTDADYETVILPHFPERKDLCLMFGIKNENITETGADCLQTFAQQLQKEFMDKPVDKILGILEQCMEQKSVLPDSLLMKLSRCVSGREIESVALEQMGIKQTDIKNIHDSRRDNIQMFSFDVLCLWRNKSVENTKQKLLKIMLQTLEKYGNLDPHEVRGVLEPDSMASRQTYVMVNGLSQMLHFCDFHVAKRRKIWQLEEKIKQMA